MLTSPTLVLNRNWIPVGVTKVRRAIGLVFVESAKVIEPETYVLHDFDSWAMLSEEAPTAECIRSIRLSFRVPEVILLTEYSNMPRAGVAFSRRNLCIRDRYSCQFCGAKLSSQNMTIDHLLPRSRGGRTTWENCVLACVPCNERKSNRTPDESRMRLRHAPRRPMWSPSFGIPQVQRRDSWRRFMNDDTWNTDGYWDVELEP
jgi:5-methylcytosine-specific restriction endonuclease McrA